MNDQVTFVQIPVDLRALYKLAATRDWGSRRGFDEGRALHHALGECFGPQALQPFRLMVPPRKRDAVIYAYSASSFEQIEEHRLISTPEYQELFGSSSIRHKQLPVHFKSGHRLGFDIRIRPVRRIKNNTNRSREIDAYQRAAMRSGDEPGWHDANTRESVYRDWLAERLGQAVELEKAKLARFQRTISVRKNGVSEGPDAVMHGVLEVKDEKAFAAMLVKGIGRHKAYGYGMILLRPPGRPPLKG